MKEYNINRILVPVDFSQPSINALNTAIAMANRHSAAIVLLNVVESAGLSGLSPDASGPDETGGAASEHSLQELQSLQRSITARFLIPCQIISVAGIISSAIVKVSGAQQTDMIIMGTHGSSGFKELCIGSNAFNVVKNAVCPVLIIPPQKKYESFKTILFPVRPMPNALEKYDVVRKMIRKDGGAKLRILGLATDYEKDVDLIKGLTEQLKEKLLHDSVEASTYFKVGKNMAEEVLKIAALMETDLIVITAIDSSLTQLFVGPYTRHIINYSRFPVLSVKPTGTGANAPAAALMQHNREAFSKEIQLYN